MVDMFVRPEWNELLLDRIMEVRIFMAEKYAGSWCGCSSGRG